MIVKEVVKEHVAWRGQIGHLAISDLKKTYSGAALGWSWAFIKPAITVFIYWFAFSSGLRHRAGIEGYPFFFWMLAGIIPWFYIQEMLVQGTGCFRRYKHLITKMKFPVSTIPTFVSVSKLMVHLCLMVAVFLLFAICGRLELTVYMLQLPLYMLMMFVFCTGWALFGATLGAISKDFANLVKSFTTAFFWMGGVMFPLMNIKTEWMLTVIKLNPVAFTAEGYRNCFIYHKWMWDSPTWLAVYLGEMLVMWILAFFTFKRLRKEMPDVL